MHIKIIIVEQGKKKITKSILRETWLNKYASGSQSGVFFPKGNINNVKVEKSIYVDLNVHVHVCACVCKMLVSRGE